MNLGIIGCGKMGSALVKGAIRENAINGQQVMAIDLIPELAQQLSKDIGATIAKTNDELIENSDAILLCVKPQDMISLTNSFTKERSSKLFISIAAGIKIDDLEKSFKNDDRIIRVMPNTPAMIGQGASAQSRGKNATESDAQFVSNILNAVGIAIEVPEKQLDAVTGLSGSGPAYIYTVIEALADGGVLVGLPKEKALKLAAKTVIGAAEMVMKSDEHPAKLRDQVASPGGTTIAGLAALESGKLRSTLIEAVKAATKRSEELGS